MKRTLSLIAAAVALWPAIALAADVSDPESLHATLPDPVDSTWVEALPGQTGYLDGPVTYDSITAYYTYYQQSSSFIETDLSILRNNRYEGGYQRTWFRPRTQDQLVEQVMVFASAARAKSASDQFKVRRQELGMFGSYFDPQLGTNAYGELDATTGYHWAAVSFLKGDAMYTVETASVKEVKPADVNPQARTFFAAAPSNIALPPPTQSALARYMVPLVVTFASGAVLIAVALVIAVVSTITARPAPTAPSGT